jgi:hypothetical protein
MMRKTTEPFIVSLMIATLWTVGCNKPNDAASATPKADPASAQSKIADTKAPVGSTPDKVTVYYFHSSKRCSTCLGIQSAVEQTIDDKFKDETGAGMLVFEEMNIEEESSKPLVDKFQIAFGTMIVAAWSKGKMIKWENADKVWELSSDRPALLTYVEDKIETYLKMVRGN